VLELFFQQRRVSAPQRLIVRGALAEGAQFRAEVIRCRHMEINNRVPFKPSRYTESNGDTGGKQLAGKEQPRCRSKKVEVLRRVGGRG